MCCSVHIIVEESYDLQMNGARNHLALIVFQVDSFSIELRRKVTRRSFSRLVTCSIISQQCKDFLTGNSSYLSASRNRVEMYKETDILHLLPPAGSLRCTIPRSSRINTTPPTLHPAAVMHGREAGKGVATLSRLRSSPVVCVSEWAAAAAANVRMLHV